MSGERRTKNRLNLPALALCAVGALGPVFRHYTDPDRIERGIYDRAGCTASFEDLDGNESGREYLKMKATGEPRWYYGGNGYWRLEWI